MYVRTYTNKHASIHMRFFSLTVDRMSTTQPKANEGN